MSSVLICLYLYEEHLSSQLCPIVYWYFVDDFLPLETENSQTIKTRMSKLDEEEGREGLGVDLVSDPHLHIVVFHPRPRKIYENVGSVWYATIPYACYGYVRTLDINKKFFALICY